MRTRLVRAGWRRGDPLVLAAAGSSDPHALDDVHRAADELGTRCGTRPVVSYVGAARPSTAEVCSRLGAGRTFVASCLLAPGLFHRRLLDLPVHAVAPPLGALPGVVDLVVARFRQECRSTPVGG